MNNRAADWNLLAFDDDESFSMQLKKPTQANSK